VPTDAVFGREREFETVARFLGHRDWPRAINLEGEPGIGKTTIWAEARLMATEAGLSVLACRPVQTEVALAFSGLVDLFENVPDSALARLPEPQHRALAAALRRRAPDRRMPDPLSVSAGVRAVLTQLAAEAPLVIAIDDAQWLDASTAAVIGYVMRRLAQEQIGLLLASRPPATSGTVTQVDLLGGALPMERLVLRPLNLSGLHHVIRSRTGQILPRPVLHRIADASGGNPFFAIAIATALLEAPGRPSPGEPLPTPRTLVDVVAQQVGRLPREHQEILLIVASLAAPTVEAVAAAAGRSVSAALAAASDAGMVDVGDDHLRFAHPLYAQCVRQLASPARRRAVHARIAEVVLEREERARHLALAVDPPDDAVAEALEEAAAGARARGALRAASELLNQASLFTSTGDAAAAHRRAFEAAEIAILAGDRMGARELLRDVVRDAESPLRERAVGLYAEVLANTGAMDEAVRLLREARERTTEPGVAARLDLDMAYLALLRFDPGEGSRRAGAAVASARASGEPTVLAEALGYEAITSLLDGREVDETVVEEALRLEDRTRPPYLGLPPSGVLGLVRAFAGRYDEARALLEAGVGALDAIGDDCDLAGMLFWSSWVEHRAGRLETAAELARGATTMAESTGSELLRSWACASGALVAAHRGPAADVEAFIAEAGRNGRPEGLAALWALAARVVAGLSMGDPPAAAAAASALATIPELSRMADPVYGFFLPDVAEALAAVGRVAEAEAVLAPFETAARARDRRWAIATGLRARGVIVARQGHLEAAIEHMRAALDHHDAGDSPVERARTLLVLGQLLRRTGERRDARLTLEAAAAALRAAGADAWAERASAELGRIPGRSAGRGVAATVLTPAEQRVAELSGAGQTNREVAVALFLSPKTVEANLGRIYRKLGITTRAELGAWLARTPDEDAPPNR
jgi:DNA-binding CsgD family transcriptional regulator